MSGPLRLLVRSAPILLMALPAPAADVVSERFRYALCRSNVASSAVMWMGERYGLSIELESDAMRELARLLDEHSGKAVELVFADRVLLRGRVESVARSGLLLIPVGDRDATSRALAEFRSSMWEGPCGLVSVSDS